MNDLEREKDNVYRERRLGFQGLRFLFPEAAVAELIPVVLKRMFGVREREGWKSGVFIAGI